MPEFPIGAARVEKIFEIALDAVPATRLLPGFDPAVLAAHPGWVAAQTYDAEGHARLSVHVWLVRHAGRVILIDLGAGNGKPRPRLPALDRLDTPFLERLAAAGVAPADVDTILLTHLHADHVGWATRRKGDSWVPTFPNATVIASEREWRYAWALAEESGPMIREIVKEAGLGQPVRKPIPGVFEDSLLPLEPAGRLRLVAIDGAEVLPGLRLVPTPGHSIDHAAIELASDGELAIFSGDAMHHPLEIFRPDLVSAFCEFPDAARASRRRLLERAAETGALVLPAHFTASSAGYVTREGEGYGWRWA